MRLAIAGLRREINRPLSVLVPLVDLVLLEAEERGLPLAVLKDLAVLWRHLERLRRAAEVAMPAAVPDLDKDSLFDLDALLWDTMVRAILEKPFHATDPQGTSLRRSISRSIVENGGTIELRSRACDGMTWMILLPGRNGSRADS